MKKIYTLALIVIFSQITYSQVGIGTTNPYSQLDVRSSNQAIPSNTDGILIPKVDTFPATNPTVSQQGMLVYLTTSTTFLATTRTAGFYFWDNTISDWIGIASTSNGDSDWYKVGTTIPPNTITDDMFHSGNVAIGKNTAVYPLEVNTTNYNTGINNIFSSSTSNGISKNGISNDLSGTSNDVLIGNKNNLSNNGSGIHYALYNDINNSGSGSQYGSFTTISNTGDGYHAGHEIDISGTGNGGQYGISTTISNSGNAPHYGIVNRLTTSGTGTQQGIFNTIAGAGNGIVTGTYNQINNSGSGDKIGIQNDISSNGATNQYAVKNNLTGTGSSVKYGIRNDFTSNGNGANYGIFSSITGNSNGFQYGTYNDVSNTGSGDHYGTFSLLSGAGTGTMYGNYTSITNTAANTQYGSYTTISGSGFGGHTGNYNLLSGASGGVQTGTYNEITNTAGSSHYGSISNLSGTGAATKYGFYATISSFAGGTHYGMYSDVVGAGNYSGYFLGNVAIGSTTANTYTLPPSRGTNLQVMLTDALGNVTWQNASAIHDNDWYKSGTVVGPTAITDDMYHTGKVGIGVTVPGYTLDLSSAGRTINSVTTSATNAGLIAFNTAASGSGAGGHGILGQTSQSGSQGIRGEQLNAAGYGTSGINFGTSGASGGSGVYAQTTQSNGFGIDSRNLNANGTGVFGLGNNGAGNYLTAGSGGAFTGITTGAYARSTTAGVGEGLYTDQFGVVTRVNYWSGTAQYKIIGTGTVSTTAEDLNGNRVTLHCTETPEILFEDYGQGQLSNGNAHIEIDPILAKNIIVNEKHPLRVFIQLEDNCNGVFVTNKTANSFDVIELASGQSNAKFQYHIIGNRIDEVLPNGRVSKNSDLRFEPSPSSRETKEVSRINIEKPTTAN